MANNLTPDWLDVQDTCKLLCISKRTLYEYKAKSILPFSQISGKLYFKKRDVYDLLEKNYTD